MAKEIPTNFEEIEKQFTNEMEDDPNSRKFQLLFAASKLNNQGIKNLKDNFKYWIGIAISVISILMILTNAL